MTNKMSKAIVFLETIDNIIWSTSTLDTMTISPEESDAIARNLDVTSVIRYVTDEMTDIATFNSFVDQFDRKFIVGKTKKGANIILGFLNGKPTIYIPGDVRVLVQK